MSNYFDTSLRYFNESKVALAEKFIPYYVASSCCHLLNLENQKREFYLEHDRLANLRIHMFMCAPPGYMKSFLLQKFILGDRAVLYETPIKSDFEGSMTEAAFTGSIKVVDGEPTIIYGAAYEHREAIVGIEEFAALANTMKMEHSVNLDNALLTALDSGLLIKRLAMGPIKYWTQITMWTGSQPSRFDLTSGMGRRLVFIFFIPTDAEMSLIRKYRRLGKNLRVSDDTLYRVRNSIEAVAADIPEIKKIVFADDFYRMMDDLRVPHFEEALYERLAMGYHISIAEEVPETLEVYTTKTLREMIDREHGWRLDVKKGAEFSQVMEVIRSMPAADMTVIKLRLVDFGLSYSHATSLLNSMAKMKMIAFVEDTSYAGPGRKPIKIISLERRPVYKKQA